MQGDFNETLLDPPKRKISLPIGMIMKANQVIVLSNKDD